MATKLVIVESPTKAHKIGDYLGKGTSTTGSSRITLSTATRSVRSANSNRP